MVWESLLLIISLFGWSVLRPEAELSGVWYLKRSVYSCPAFITWFHPIWFTLSKMWRQNVNRRNADFEHIISGVFSGVFASPRPSVAVYNTILDSSTHRECYCLGFIGLHALWQISLGIEKFNPGATPWYISSLNYIWVRWPDKTDSFMLVMVPFDETQGSPPPVVQICIIGKLEKNQCNLSFKSFWKAG